MKGGPEQGRNRNNGGKGQRKDVRDKRLRNNTVQMVENNGNGRQMC